MIAEIAAGIVKGIYDIVRNTVRAGHPETVQSHIDKNEYIQLRLEELLDRIGASRIYIIQFHNGGYFYSGNPMQRFSCTYEAVNDWVAPCIGDLQNRLVSEYPLLHSTLLADGEFYIHNVSQFTDSAMRQKFEKRGIETFYSVCIWDLGGNKIGNVSVNFVGHIKSMTEDDKELVRDFAKQIVGFILQAERPSDSIVIKFIMAFVGLACASQLIYFLNNFFILLHSLGPTIITVFKTLLDFL